MIFIHLPIFIFRYSHPILQARCLCKCWHLPWDWTVFSFSFSQGTKSTPILQGPAENFPSQWTEAQPSPPFPELSEQMFQNFMVKSLRATSVWYCTSNEGICVCVHQKQEEPQVNYVQPSLDSKNLGEKLR